MLRLQQVTMMALHNFLGLTQELINYVSIKALFSGAVSGGLGRACPPPIVETRRKIVNLVGILVLKHRKIARKIGKSATKALVMLLSGKFIYEKSCRFKIGCRPENFFGLSENYCSWPPKHNPSTFFHYFITRNTCMQ
jgi:hypothetical protein